MNLAILLLLAALSLEGQPLRAFWADAFNRGFKNPADIDQMAENLSLAKANAIIVQMRRRGDSYYLRSLEPPAQDPGYSPNFDALEYLIQRAHARGIEVHAWFNVGPAWLASLGTPQDPRHIWNRHGPKASGDDMWLTISSTGAVSDSLDLGRPEVARYLAGVIVEPAKHYELAGAQVLVTGTAAPLFSVSPERMELRMPCLPAPSWNIVVRRAGLESAPFRLSAAAATPVTLGVRQLADGRLEIYASGLGAANPLARAGSGGAAEEPFSRSALPVVVRLRAGQGEFILQPLYAGLTPYLPGRYQVNVQAPQGVMAGELKLQAGEAVSAGFNC